MSLNEYLSVEAPPPHPVDVPPPNSMWGLAPSLPRETSTNSPDKSHDAQSPLRPTKISEARANFEVREIGLAVDYPTKRKANFNLFFANLITPPHISPKWRTTAERLSTCKPNCPFEKSIQTPILRSNETLCDRLYRQCWDSRWKTREIAKC